MQEYIFRIGENQYKILFTSQTTGSFRPNEFKSKFVPQPPSEFITDINIQAKVLTEIFNRTRAITINDLEKSLIKACDRHITKYGRLCDSDLYSLIDCSMFILAGIGFQDKEQIFNIYKQFVYRMITKYRDYMFEATHFGPMKMF